MSVALRATLVSLVAAAALLAVACADALDPEVVRGACGSAGGDSLPAAPANVAIQLDPVGPPDQLPRVYKLRVTWDEVAADEKCYRLEFRAERGGISPGARHAVELPADAVEWTAPGNYANPMDIEVAVAAANGAGRSSYARTELRTTWYE